MIIKHPWRESADYIAANLEGLVDRRRLMDRAGDRLEILGVKSKRVNVAVPANDIERMMGVDNSRPAWAVFYQHRNVFLLVDNQGLGRTVEVTLGIRRAHSNLTFQVQVTARDANRTGRFEDEVIFFLHLIGHESISDPARNHDVVLGTVTQSSEGTLEGSPTLEDKDDFVRAAVPEILVFAVGLLRFQPVSDHVLVEEHRDPAGVEVAPARDVRCLEMMMAERRVGNLFQLLTFEQLNGTHPGGRPEVIHDGVGLVEALRGDDVLVVDAFVLVTRAGAIPMKPDMVFPWDFPKLLILRHNLTSC